MIWTILSNKCGPKSGFEETSARDQLKWSLNLNHKMWNSISTVTSWVLKWTQYSTFLGSVREIGWPWVHQESFKLCYQPKRICATFIQDCSCSCTSLKWYIYRNCWFLNWGSSKYMRWMINKPEREREFCVTSLQRLASIFQTRGKC